MPIYQSLLTIGFEEGFIPCLIHMFPTREKTDASSKWIANFKHCTRTWFLAKPKYGGPWTRIDQWHRSNERGSTATRSSLLRLLKFEIICTVTHSEDPTWPGQSFKETCRGLDWYCWGDIASVTRRSVVSRPLLPITELEDPTSCGTCSPFHCLLHPDLEVGQGGRF